MEAVKRIAYFALGMLILGLCTAGAGLGLKFFWRAFMLGWDLI